MMSSSSEEVYNEIIGYHTSVGRSWDFLMDASRNRRPENLEGVRKYLADKHEGKIGGIGEGLNSWDESVLRKLAEIEEEYGGLDEETERLLEEYPQSTR